MRSLSATSIHIFIMQAVNVEQEGSNVMGNIDQKKPYSSTQFDWFLFASITMQVVVGIFFQLSVSTGSADTVSSSISPLFTQHILHVSTSIILGVLAFRYYSIEAINKHQVTCLALTFTLLIITHEIYLI